MARPRQCTSCLFFVPQSAVPKKIFNIMSLDYDGWCKWFREERDRHEKICKNYKKQVERSGGMGKNDGI